MIVKESTSKTHIPVLTERAARINSIIIIFHLIVKERSHTLFVCWHIAAHSVTHLFVFNICIAQVTRIETSEFCPFVRITVVGNI